MILKIIVFGLICNSTQAFAELKFEFMAFSKLIHLYDRLESSSAKEISKNKSQNWFYEMAIADDPDLCLTAGYIGKRDQKRVCRVDPSFSANSSSDLLPYSDETKTKIVCNPDVFGPGVVITKPKNARWTYDCANAFLKMKIFKNEKKIDIDQLTEEQQKKVTEYFSKADQSSLAKNARRVCKKLNEGNTVNDEDLNACGTLKKYWGSSQNRNSSYNELKKAAIKKGNEIKGRLSDRQKLRKELKNKKIACSRDIFNYEEKRDGPSFLFNTEVTFENGKNEACLDKKSKDGSCKCVIKKPDNLKNDTNVISFNVDHYFNIDTPLDYLDESPVSKKDPRYDAANPVQEKMFFKIHADFLKGDAESNYFNEFDIKCTYKGKEKHNDETAAAYVYQAINSSILLPAAQSNKTSIDLHDQCHLKKNTKIVTDVIYRNSPVKKAN